MGILWLVIGVVILAYLAAFKRSGSAKVDRMGRRRLELHSKAPPEVVFKRVAAIGGPLRVDDKDPLARVLVLSSPLTLMSWGFLYPVHLHADGKGTRIEIGCKSKFVQWGPVVTRAHEKAVAAIREAITPVSARAAS